MDVSNDVTRHAYDGDGKHVKWIKGTPEAIQELADSNGWTLSEDGPAAPNPLHRDLSSAGFNWLLAYTGLEDGWDALLDHFKATDRGVYASLKEARSKDIYRLDVTLQTVASFRSTIDVLKGQGSVPSDLDVSDEAIIAGWEAAAGRNEE